MNTQRKLIVAISLCAAFTVPGLSFGALIDRGGGLIYDTDLDVTWLADANYAQTSGYDSNGRMSWTNAMTWAANLSYYDSVRNVTYDDWRLPTSDTCEFFNCTGSELGHLFYSELGGVAGQPIVTTHDADYNLFTNIQDYYWSSTGYQYGSEPIVAARYHYFRVGWQYWEDEELGMGAWAVRDGDVYAASTVPIPAAAWLFGSGLLWLIGVARKRR